jgi:hypothetical protein
MPKESWIKIQIDPGVDYEQLCVQISIHPIYFQSHEDDAIKKRA